MAEQTWINEYIEQLSKEDKQACRYKDSKSLFRFGDGGKVISYYAIIPTKIGFATDTAHIDGKSIMLSICMFVWI